MTKYSGNLKFDQNNAIDIVKDKTEKFQSHKVILKFSSPKNVEHLLWVRKTKRGDLQLPKVAEERATCLK